ncbi:hypothetical protein Ngar_c04870 [Candidatus Nitrososphaera gargensis Ga9.2]|uniref:Uncharacterized protein n=1 Tax=Nitrososphaera gargensis (strain Ga9.2) TaxID=1237085 RepID=K0I832_NITGG|nr:hypothetical protein [Candidatus Nitrososphaera gargensis]AFU57431.1 hypothetical protein Ngar_c04870 [Candidatus Nitrososphaera gargensis Ga9.2]
MTDDQNNSNNLECRLSGRTLQVYLYLQKKKEASRIREVQRDLGLSSPSVAEYQVEKLVEMGLAGRDSYGRVFVTRKVKVKALESYVNFGRFTVPRLAFYASIFTAIAALYAVFNFNSLNVYDVAVPAGAAAIFWFEAWKLWKYSLFEKAKKPAERDYFWASLMPGLAALAVFIAGTFFLFYYVEPSGLVSTAPPPADPNALPFQSAPQSPLTVDDLPAPQRNTGGDLPWLGFSPLQITILLFAGALVAGFVVYLMVKYRCDRGVLVSEQEWN